MRFFIYVLGFLYSPSLQVSARSTLQQLKVGKYQEDLSPYRIAWTQNKLSKGDKPATTLFSIPLERTQMLASLLHKRKLAYQQHRSVKGYTIQVYMGDSRAAALKAKDLAGRCQEIYLPELYYRQPIYTIRLGFFIDRLEAYFFYLSLLHAFPRAMIRPLILPYATYRSNQGSQDSLS